MLARDTLLQNRYRIVRLLAEGGMGAVYEAIDERLGNIVALKKTRFSDEQMRKAFEREARLLARLRHPALPVVSDHFTEDDGQFLVMQFIPGDDLEEMLTRRGTPFSPDEALVWADQLLDALDYLHTQQPPIIHRDIKPQNLKLTDRGQIVLLDFGLAKGEATNSTRLGPAKSIYGFTPYYAPLEQIQGAGTDQRSDLYSLAATLYHLMTGVIPPSALVRLSAVAGNEPDPMRPAGDLNPAINAAISRLLEWATEIRSDRRPASAEVLRKAFNDAKRSQTVMGRGGQKTEDLPPTRLATPVTRRIDALPSDPQRPAPSNPQAGQPYSPTQPGQQPSPPSWPTSTGPPPPQPSWPPSPPHSSPPHPSQPYSSQPYSSQPYPSQPQYGQIEQGQQGWHGMPNPQASHPSWPPSYPQAAYQPRPVKRSNSAAWVIGIIGVVIAIGLVAIFALLANSDLGNEANSNRPPANANRSVAVANANTANYNTANYNSGVTNSSTAPNRSEIAQILDRYVEAIGGRVAWQSFPTRVATGTFEMPELGVNGTVEIYAKAPDKLMLALTLPGTGTTRTGFNGTLGWAEDPAQGLRQLAGDELEEAKRNARFYSNIEIESTYPKLEIKGTEKIAGRDAYVIEATAADGKTNKMYFDKANGLLVCEENTRTTLQGLVPTKTFYEDYTNIDGLYMPLTLRQTNSGLVFILKLKEVKHNVAIDDSKFNMPRSR